MKTLESESLEKLLLEISACRVCRAHLPLGPRPIVQLAETASLLIMSQAPGRKAHQTGIPWNDASGERLRDWIGLDRATFYDETKVAIIPMAFCYPGAGQGSADKPPRPECAPLWHERVLRHLPNLQMTLLVGHHAQRHYFGPSWKYSMTETVKAFSDYGRDVFPLPHPSWRSTIWMRKHPWFEKSVIPELRRAVKNATADVNSFSQRKIS